ncbi:MAG: hypothetical protein OEZ31_05810 [Nitrospirota bacterium]|nr:hypothetical protein [Nitrospirota bacterium]MDH5768458.1 hypothetical protein [Nitrospirota bacterium]
MRKFFLTCLICLIAGVVYASDIRVSVSEVRDTRTTGHFSGMEIKLKVMGDIISDAKGLKLKITKAIDDTDRDLLKDDRGKEDFTKPDEYNIGQAEVEVKLKNPSRKAITIKELIGEMSMFIPKNDPDATATINNFMTQTGKPLSDTALKEAQVEVTILTKSQYDEIKEMKKKEAKEKEGDLAKEFGEAMVQAFSSLFGSMMEVGENSVILNIKDPESKIVAIEFIDESGKKINNISSMKMGDVRVFEFEKPMTQKARMAIFMVTPKSLIKTPLKLADIALP